MCTNATEWKGEFEEETKQDKTVLLKLMSEQEYRSE